MGITDVGDNSSSILKVWALYSKRQPTPKLWIFCSGLTRLRLIADETKSVTRFNRWSVSVTATMLQQLWFSVDFGDQNSIFHLPRASVLLASTYFENAPIEYESEE